MRTKTLILTAALGLAGVATSMAQSNVYSLNIVGYVNLTVVPGFNLIANQLNTTNNTLNSLIPSVPDGSQIFKFVPGSGYTIFNFDQFNPGWAGTGAATPTLNPGEAAFFKNPTTTNLTLTFVGEVLTGSSTNPLPAGFSMRSSIIPQAGDVVTLGLPAADGDQLFKFRPAGLGYLIYNFDQFNPGWGPSNPVVNVGEGFFIKKAAAANWVRTFTVN